MADQIKHLNKLKGARVLVIGGTAGIGYGVAEAAVEYGAHVILSSSQESRVQSAVEKLLSDYPSAKGKVNGYACNLADQETLEKNIEELFQKVGGELDHVVFTAGDSLAVQSLEEVELSQIIQGGMVRFFSPLLVAKHAHTYLKRSYTSSLTLTSGAVADRPLKEWAIPAAYAGGLQAMVQGLALVLAPIRVNLVTPGAVLTPLWDGMLPPGQKEALLEQTAKRMLTGRVGQSEDVAEAYVYAMKDYNVTGANIKTHGGGIFM